MATAIVEQSRVEADRYTAIANANPVSGRPQVYDRLTKTYLGTFGNMFDATHVAQLLNAEWKVAQVADTKRAIERSQRAQADAALGMTWWNAMTKQARLAALRAVEPNGRASADEAWQHWKRTTAGFKCEEVAHG